jgi:hypothetical protein
MFAGWCCGDVIQILADYRNEDSFHSLLGRVKHAAGSLEYIF